MNHDIVPMLVLCPNWVNRMISKEPCSVDPRQITRESILGDHFMIVFVNWEGMKKTWENKGDLDLLEINRCVQSISSIVGSCWVNYTVASAGSEIT